jgi:hypothetical protein
MADFALVRPVVGFRRGRDRGDDSDEEEERRRQSRKEKLNRDAVEHRATAVERRRAERIQRARDTIRVMRETALPEELIRQIVAHFFDLPREQDLFNEALAAAGGSKASGYVQRMIAENKLQRRKVKNPSDHLRMLLSKLPKKDMMDFMGHVTPLPPAPKKAPAKKATAKKSKKQMNMSDFFSGIHA